MVPGWLTNAAAGKGFRLFLPAVRMKRRAELRKQAPSRSFLTSILRFPPALRG
jgi:hypothetical protein